MVAWVIQSQNVRRFYNVTYLTWIVAAVLRIALGSATVAAISTTGIVLPLLQHSDVNVALVVLAIEQEA